MITVADRGPAHLVLADPREVRAHGPAGGTGRIGRGGGAGVESGALKFSVHALGVSFQHLPKPPGPEQGNNEQPPRTPPPHANLWG